MVWIAYDMDMQVTIWISAKKLLHCSVLTMLYYCVSKTKCVYNCIILYIIICMDTAS